MIIYIAAILVPIIVLPIVFKYERDHNQKMVKAWF